MKKSIFRITSVFLCLVILLQTLPLAVMALELWEETSVPASSAPASENVSEPSESLTEPTVLGEVEALRQPNQKTFRMSDGSFRAAIYPHDVHYEGEDGALYEIDNTLSSDTDGGEGVLANGANASTVRFFKKSSSGKFYSLENEDSKVTVSIEGAKKVDAVFENTPADSGNRMALTSLTGSVRYAEIFPDVDLEYTLVSKRIKENIIIREKDALSSLTYTYAFNGGVRAVQEDGQRITVYRKNSDEVIFTVTAPALWDSAGKTDDSLTLSIVEEKNSKLTVRLDFTVGEDMVYPVTVDPVLQFQAERNDIQDTHIIASLPTTNYNANNHIRIRNDGYALLQFPTPTLRPGDKIVGAEFALFPYGYFDSNPGYSNANSYNPTLKLTAHAINSPWNEKTVTYQNASPDNGFYDATAQSYHVVGSNDSFYSWDITRLANEWTEGTRANHGILLKYAAPPSDGSTFDTFFCSTNGAYLQQVVWPQIVYSYINTVGVEDYFSYHTQSLGFAGEGYVNDMTGNLTVTRELVTTGGNLAPISLSLIYNTSAATTTASAPYGTGWKLNLAQKCVQITPPGSEKTYVQYTDADGTHHYFKTDSATGLWVDEIDPDRKIYWISSNNDLEMKDSSGTTLRFTKREGYNEWYLYQIVDIYGNYVNVNLDSSDLNRVNSAVSSDGNGVYMDYSPYGFLTAVRYMDTGAVKTVSVQYNSRMTTHNNGVTDVIFPDGSAARYNYWDGTFRLSTAQNLNGAFIQYDYHNTSGRVSAVSEVSSAGVVGNKFTFAYEPTATTVLDEKLGRTYLYTFSANGTLKSVVDTTANDGNGYGKFYEWGGGNTSLTGMGNLTFASKTQKNTVNLLSNHSFEQEGYVSGVSYGTDSGSYGFTDEKARTGSRSYQLTAPVSENYDVIYGFYHMTLPASEEYTLSAYINTKDMEPSAGGARVVAIVGSQYYYSEYITEAKDEWQRLSVTFPVEQAQTVSLCTSLSGAAGSIYFDNMQLEVGGLSDYNLLENAGFEIGSGYPSFWSSGLAQGSQTAASAISGKSVTFSVNPNVGADILQTVSVPDGKAGDTYVASAFARATSVPAEGWRFTLLVRFVKNGATVNEQNILFNSHTTAWQKVAGAAKATGDYDAVQFWLLYYENCNTVYFDNAQLIRDTFGNTYTYDADGNLITTVDLQGKEENTFRYDGNNQLIRQSNISGGHVLYTYDSAKKTQLQQVSAGGNTTFYTYDNFGNATTATTSGSALVPGEYYYLQNIYYSKYVQASGSVGFAAFDGSENQKWKLIQNSDGSYSLEPKNAVGTYLTATSLTDNGSLALQTASSGASQKFTLEKHYGNIYFLKTQSDPAFALDGDGTNCYTYSVNGGPCQQFALIPVNVGTETYPVLSSSAQYSQNGAYMTSLTDSRGYSVSYTYNTDRGYVLSETDPQNVTTTYAYTLGEQLARVSVADSTVLYTYDSAKQLTAITAPTGSVYGITYDAFGRKSGITVGTNTLAAYTYNAIGQTETLTYGNGTVVRYTYDDLGRLVLTSVNDIPQTKTVYDGSSRVHEQYDLVGNRKVKFEYDLLGREVKRSLYDTASGALLSEVRTSYDDTKNRIAGYTVTAGGKTTSYTYGYGENKVAPEAVTSVSTNGTKLIENEYDYLNRLSTRTLNTATPVETSYTYLPGADATKTTTLVSSMQTGSEILSYAYDARGNITSVSKNGSVYESYTYDAKNQLSSVTRGSDTWEYTYDDNGNILSVVKNNEEEKYYLYQDPEWKDLLTEYQGWDITYDAIGNPLQYRNGIEMTWTNGRKLASVSLNELMATFTYDGEGNRIRKVGKNGTVDYIVIGGTIYGEIRTVNGTTTTLHYLFDETGTRIGFVHNGTDAYYYRFNLQGDVTGIYNASGTLVAEYAYDVWGNLIDSDNTAIGLLNPIRYRGYYYDTETGFYFLQTRYYDPETGRFINADGLVSTGQGILGYNMFAYCGNNPVMLEDPSGTIAVFAIPITVKTLETLIKILLILFTLQSVGEQIENTPSTRGDFDFPNLEENPQKNVIREYPKASFHPNSLSKTQSESISTKVIERYSKKKNKVIFPVNPLDFHPIGLEMKELPGSKNGKFYIWKDTKTNTVIFRWDENINYDNGPHYHIIGIEKQHYYGGVDAVPAPLDDLYFPQ